MVNATDLKKGMCITHNGELYRVFSTHHHTPGNLRGMVQAKLRSLRTGSIIEHRFRSTDRVERAILHEVEMEYLYHEGSTYHFMNTETYEQIAMDADLLGDGVNYLVANTKINIEYYEHDPVGIELPASVLLKVVETEPGLKGATISNVTKPATLETGLVVQVPPFINVGEVIRVDTSEGRYIERAK
jgi:elongation factor P